MPLTKADLEGIQADAMADDVEIDLEKMSLWTTEQAVTYFESGGEVEPPPPIAAFTAPFTNGKTPTGTTPWLSCLEKKPNATSRIVVFSWTGNRGGQGSAHNIRRGPPAWSKEVGDSVEVYEIALPGRGTRMKDPLEKDTSVLVEKVAKEVGAALNGGLPYALVGFAFGSILAYEVGRKIQVDSKNTEGPALLVTVSSEGPSWPGRATSQHKLSDALGNAFLGMLKKKGGTEFILKDPGMTKMYVPVIHADLTLEETYKPPKQGEVAAFPITAIAGKKPGRDQEKSLIKKEDAELWGQATSAPFKAVIVDTDWYVLQEESGVKAVLAEVKGFMAEALAPVAVS